MLQENLKAYGFVVKNANVNILEISTQKSLRKIMNYAEETETIAFFNRKPVSRTGLICFMPPYHVSARQKLRIKHNNFPPAAFPYILYAVKYKLKNSCFRL
jgi:hypothetical protein